MAAIDFPAAPTNGQTFSAPNGVTYRWQATPGVWVAVGAVAAGADVMAGGGTFTPSTGVPVPIVFPTFISGAGAAYLNTSNGRYTPPAGRYYLQCTNGVQAPVGGNGTWTLQLRKNGVAIPNAGGNASGSASFSIPITVDAIVDANGTDYFEFTANCLAAGMAAQGGQFVAYPISGIQGPAGVVGTPAVGEFFGTSSQTIAAGATVQIPITVTVGNAGGYYNPANGRFTPPAGRYMLFAGSGGVNSGAATQLATYLRKNGVVIVGPTSSSAGANFYGSTPAEAVVDANGTDYFEAYAWSNNGTSGVGQTWFGAFPISGSKGQQGDPGAVGQAGANAFNIRASANDTLSGPGVITLFRTGFGGVIKDYDPDNVIDAANSARFTAPNAGRYHFDLHAYGNSSVAMFCVIGIRHTNSGGTSIRNYVSGKNVDTNNYGSDFEVSADIQMAAGDRVDWAIAANGATTLTINASGGTSALTGALTFASGHRVN